VIPALALRPSDSEALGQVMRLCNENRLPLTVRGAGTNLSGGTIPISEGVVVLTNALNRILEINEADMYAVVQPGVVTAELAAAAEAKGLFYPPDPGSQAVSTLGGNVAENAGGLRGLKYGVTRDYVLGIQFFDVNGDIVKTGSRTVKCATGYNLTGLMVGSEGTLGVFNEITLKLIPSPAYQKAMVAVFDKMENASETVAAIIASHIVPATLEFMDNFTIRAVEDYSKVGLPTSGIPVPRDGCDICPCCKRCLGKRQCMGGPAQRAFRTGKIKAHAGSGRCNRSEKQNPRHGAGHAGYSETV